MPLSGPDREAIEPSNAGVRSRRSDICWDFMQVVAFLPRGNDFGAHRFVAAGSGVVCCRAAE
jgi:hypothetical protein